MLIAVSILTLIISVAYKSLSQIMKTKQVLDEERDLSIIANSVLRRLTRELQLATDESSLLPAANSTSDVPSASTDLEGEKNKLSNGERGDTITFMANDAGQYVPDGQTHTGTVQITYRVEKDPEQRGVDPKKRTYLLIRDEIPDIRPYDRAHGNRMTFPVTDRLLGLEFEYFNSDSGQWQGDWSSNEDELPAIVRFRLKLQTAGGQKKSYSSALLLGSR